MNIPRRITQLLTISIIMVIIFCTNVQSQNVITLSILVPPYMQDRIDQEVLQEFEQSHPDVTIVIKDNSSILFPPARFGIEEHLIALETFASTADILFVDSTRFSIESTRTGFFLDLAPLVSTDSEISTHDFYSTLWNSFQWDGGIWGLPLSATVQLLIYDPQAFDTAGLSYPDETWGIHDFTIASERLAIRGNNDQIIRPGLAVSSMNLLLRATSEHSFFDPTESPPLYQPDFMQPELTPNLEQWITLQREGFVSRQIGLFDSGDLPLTIDNAHRLVSRPGDTNQLAGALLPGGHAGLLVNGFAVSAGTEHPELAYELVVFLTSQIDIVNSTLGDFPARQSLSQHYQRVFNYPNDVEALINRGIENGFSPSELIYTGYLDTAMDTAISENMDIALALQQAESQAYANLALAEDLSRSTHIVLQSSTSTDSDRTLHFGLETSLNMIPNEAQWMNAIAEFVDNDNTIDNIILSSTSGASRDYPYEYDCFYMPNNMTSQYHGVVLGLDPLVNSDAAFDPSDVVGNILDQLSSNDQLLAYPIAIYPNMLWYNHEVFQENNIQFEGDSSYTGFFNILRRLDESKTQDQPLLMPTDVGNTHLLMLMAAYGELPLDYRSIPSDVNLTDPDTVVAIRTILDWVKSDVIAYYPPDDYNSVTLGILNNAIYTDVMNADSPFLYDESAFVPEMYPSGDRYTPVSYDIGAAYISASTQYPEACYRWITFVAQRPSLVSGIPARYSQISDSSASLQTNTSSDFYLRYSEALQAIDTVNFPSRGNDWTGAFVEQLWLNQAFDSYISDDADLEVVLQETQDRIDIYRQCTADIPPFQPTHYETDEARRDYFIQFTNCAVSIDPGLNIRFNFEDQ